MDEVPILQHRTNQQLDHHQSTPTRTTQDPFYSIGTEEQYEYTLTTTATHQQEEPSVHHQIHPTTTTTSSPSPRPQPRIPIRPLERGSHRNPPTQQQSLMNANKAVTATFILEDENQPPVAKDDYATVQENSTNNQINVLANDSDPDGDNLTIISVKQPLHGNATTDGLFAYYTPNASYFGPDSFTYTISDGAGGTATATVSHHGYRQPPNEHTPLTNRISRSRTMEKPTSASPLISGGLGGDPDIGDTVTYDVYFGMTTTPPKVASNQSTNTFTSDSHQ